MSNSSVVSTRPHSEARALALTNRSLWFTLLLALLLIAALLFAFSARTIAAPSETTISQRLQNSVLARTTNISATYGEWLTVTMRFTVTANTTLTGPVYLSTRFPGVTNTANSQLSLRFLGYQDPVTAAAGTPPLAVNSFTSSTIGTSPNPTTILTWTFDSISNPGPDTYVYDVAYQVRLAWDGTPDTGSSVSIPNQGNQTYISWAPYGAANTKVAAAASFNPIIKPDLGAPYSTKTYRASPGVQGGAIVVYTITLKNGNNSTNFSTAYDLFVTDSLDSRLTYNSAFPTPDSVSSIPGQNTVISWTPGSLTPNTSWVAYITATLPPTLAANTRYTNTVIPFYTTLPDIAPDEGSFTPIISTTVAGGITGTKQVAPLDNVPIGDTVTYTIKITVSPNVYLNNPAFTDALPKGFHYRPGTFNLSGDLSLNGAPITSVTGLTETLGWAINNVPLAGVPRYATVTYVAGVTGVNTDGTLAYTSTAELQAEQNAINSVQASWQDDVGSHRALLVPWNSTTKIAQPYLANPANFTVTLNSWQPFTASMEVASKANYGLSVRNTGSYTAYEVVLSDLLPPGVVYEDNLGVQPGNLELWQVPNTGATGAIQFSIKQLPPNTTALLTFDALVSNAARPGDALVNQLSLQDYSSQPGGKNDGNGNDNDFTGVYDRQYGAIPAAIPAPKLYTFTLKGLTAVKSDLPDPVLPGQVMTYFITYSNTSAVYSANSVLIIDTYDPLLTFAKAVPAPNSQNPSAHTLTWNAGTLSANSGNTFITANFTVAVGISRTVRVVTNTITSDSASPAPPMSRIVTTTLLQPKPTISLDDKGVTVTANSLMTYTMIYANASAATGATTGTFSVTLDYAPYITFITSTGRLPVPGTSGTLFTDTLGPGISRTVQLRMRVQQPLPYNLTSFTSTATIYQPNADISDTDSEETPVALPIYQLVKTRSTPSNLPVTANESLAYVIAVTNTGSVTGTNIVITDVWDANTYNQLGGSNKWTLHSTYAVYTTVASLPPGASVQLDVLNMNVTSTLPSNAQVIRNIAQLTSLQTTQQQTIYDTPVVGLHIQKSHRPDPVYPGQLLTYTINYTAYSPAIVSPVITDALPPGVTYLSCAGAESCNLSNSSVVWHWPGGLGQGASGAVTLVVRAPNTEGITLTNTYVSTSTAGAPYRIGLPDSTYVGRPHLFITKRANTAVTPVAPGDLITYTLTYTNSGSYKATGVVAHDTMPANTAYQGCAGAACNMSGGVVNWTLGDIPVSTRGVLTMTVRVNANAGATTIANTAYNLTADRGVTNDNTPPAVNTIVARPALSVTKSASPTWLSLTGSVTYTIRYTNTGGGTFTLLRFTDTLHSKTTFQSASSNCVNTSNTVVCTDNNNLAPGQSRQVTIRVGPFGLSNGEVVTNAVKYIAANQTEVLPQATTPPIEVPASNVGAAADFVGTPRSGNFPLNVTFTNLSSGSGILSCAWNFGDGGTSPSCGSTVNHTYNQAGVFTVSLTINTGSGGNTRTRIAYITTTGTAVPGVIITSPQPAKSGAKGTQVVYTLIITNTGNVPDSFTLSLPSSGYQWITNLNPNSTGTLSPQGSAVATATVNIPSSGPLFDSDIVTITATSAGSSIVKSSVVLKTSILVYPVYLPLIKK